MSDLAYIKTENGTDYAVYPYLHIQYLCGDGNPEEKVRMSLYNRLQTEHNYPAELIDIEFPVYIREDEQPRFADIVVFNDKEHKRPLIVVEAKKPNREDGEKQGQRYATILRAVYVLWSNGENESSSVIVNRYPEDAVNIKRIPDYEGQPQYNISELQPFKDKKALSSTIRKCHNYIRNHDKKKPSVAFMEFLKIMLVKLDDEFKESDYDMQILFKGTPAEQEESNETAQRVRLLFQQIVKNESSVNRIYKEDEDIQLSNETLFQIVKTLQKHSFSTTEADIKAAAFETFLSGDLRQEFKEFMTPREVVTAIVEMAEPKTKDMILDPCCGTAAFLIYSLDYVRNKINAKKLSDVQRVKLVFDFAHDSLWGMDDNPDMSLVSKLHMRLNDDGRSHIFNFDSLNKIDNAPGEIRNERFRFVFTNPPFGSRITGPKEFLDNFKVVRAMNEGVKKQSKEKGYLTEVLFLERNIQWLESGGEMFIVLPDSVLNNVNLKSARSYIETLARLKAVISLPANTFGPSGAKSKTSVLVFQKWSNTDTPSTRDEQEVFLADVREIGYDFTGRKTKQASELPMVVEAYLKWKKDRVNPNNDNQLCKVVNRGTLGEDWIAQSHFGKVSESKFKTKKLSEICDSIGTGKTAPRTQYTESGKVIVKVGNLSGRGISYENIERQFVTKEWANKYPDIELEEGDILFTAAAHGPKWIGLKVDIFNGLPVRLGKSAIYCAELMRCRVSADSGIDPYYVLLFLRSSKGYEELQKCIRGQSGHIYPNEVAQIDVPLPDNFDEKEIEKAIKDIKRCLSLKKQSEQLDTEVTDYCDNVFEARSKKPIIAR